jgi:hypothetical protein
MGKFTLSVPTGKNLTAEEALAKLVDFISFLGEHTIVSLSEEEGKLSVAEPSVPPAEGVEKPEETSGKKYKKKKKKYKKKKK